MEYAPLCWVSAPTTSLRLLDSIQRKALRIIGVNEKQTDPRRQVAATALLYKMHTTSAHQTRRSCYLSRLHPDVQHAPT
ncbi:Hypp6008 [Branchiostoma lanceolatum]|uniref:Hypp6008 protein n=1 Tax=Branchiostoma lanceolatum TaxID=7740 RepID=A0A8J9VHF4_BRALA|nr:Hypp6008 [Branchiostoma lanceolatum]